MLMGSHLSKFLVIKGFVFRAVLYHAPCGFNHVIPKVTVAGFVHGRVFRLELPRLVFPPDNAAIFGKGIIAFKALDGADLSEYPTGVYMSNAGNGGQYLVLRWIEALYSPQYCVIYSLEFFFKGTDAVKGTANGHRQRFVKALVQPVGVLGGFLEQVCCLLRVRDSAAAFRADKSDQFIYGCIHNVFRGKVIRQDSFRRGAILVRKRMETEGQTCEILLGGYSAMDSERYVSVGDGNAYLVKEDPLPRFETELGDLIRNDEIPDFEEVTQVQFSGAESEKIVYEEDSADTYYAEDVYFMKRGGESLPLDSVRVDDYLDTVRNLNLKDYVTYNVTEEELKAYGMDTPELSIQLDYTTADEGSGEKTSGVFTLQIGRDPAEREKEEAAGEASEETEEEVTAYARVGESQIIYQITADQYEKLMNMSYDALRHQEMFWADFGDMYQLDISLEGETYTITSKMDEEEEKRIYYYHEEEQEMAGIRGAVRGLRATGFTDEQPVQKEEIALTIYLDNENYPEVSIQLYRYDGDSCIAVVDGNVIAFVERAAVVDLVEAVHTIILD